MGKRERKFDEGRILEYKETNDERLFQEIIQDINVRKYINYVCGQKIKNSPTTLYSLEDLVNISYLVIWQAIHKFRFICPVCDLHAKSNGAYKLHTLARHGSYVEPKVSISRYLKFNLGAYLQNTIKREYSIDRRSNVMTINIFSPDEADTDSYGSTYEGTKLEIVSNVCLEETIIFQDVIEKVKNMLEPFSMEVFEHLYKGNLKQKEIAALFYEQGRYTSEQSAAVVISRVIKNKINPIIVSMYPELTKY
jgi:hypothetical protein